jgi:hypothetical protein
MGDYFRYLATSDCDLTLQAIESLFQTADSQFAIHIESSESNSGDLFHASTILGDIELNRPGDQIFDEDIAELIEAIEGIDDAGNSVIEQLRSVRLMVALQLTEEGHVDYDRIDPLWDRLFETCNGLLQVDEEGYYDQTGIILAVD